MKLLAIAGWGGGWHVQSNGAAQLNQEQASNTAAIQDGNGVRTHEGGSTAWPKSPAASHRHTQGSFGKPNSIETAPWIRDDGLSVETCT